MRYCVRVRDSQEIAGPFDTIGQAEAWIAEDWALVGRGIPLLDGVRVNEYDVECLFTPEQMRDRSIARMEANKRPV